MEVFTAYREVLLPDGSVSELEIPLAYANDPVGPVSLVEAARRGYDLSLIKDKNGGQLLSDDEMVAARATAAGIVPKLDEFGLHFMLPTIESARADYEAKKVGMEPVFSQMEDTTVRSEFYNPKEEMQSLAGTTVSYEKALQTQAVYVGPSKNADVQKYLKEEQYEQEKKLPALICDWLVQNYLIKIWKGELYLYNINRKYYQKMKNQDVDYIINMNFGEKIKGTAICGGQRPLMRISAAARRSLTATLVRRFR